jgi:hypothetical protein
VCDVSFCVFIVQLLVFCFDVKSIALHKDIRRLSQSAVARAPSPWRWHDPPYVAFSIETSNALFSDRVPRIFTVLVVGRITLLHQDLSFYHSYEENRQNN